MKRQNDWVSWLLGLGSLIVGLVPVADWSGIFSAVDMGRIFNAACLCIGLLMVVLLLLRVYGKRYSVVSGLDSCGFYETLQSELRESAEVLIWSPDKSKDGCRFIECCCERSIGLSILGNSDQLRMLITLLENWPVLCDRLNIVGVSNRFTLVFICDRARRRVHAGCLSGGAGVVFGFRGSKVASSIHRLIHEHLLIGDQPIRLSQIANPSAFLDVVYQANRRYIDNFTDLKSGFISFYGTEVLNVQSGWLESGRFSRIRTLDLTTNPALLLTRERYLQANKTFISKQGNSIERVFVVERGRLRDEAFRCSLQQVVSMQIEWGISVDVRLLDSLADCHQQDFILYDDFSVLVEERQANSDYSFGKSTAYFGKEKIEAYEEIFKKVWKKEKTKAQIDDFLRQYA